MRAPPRIVGGTKNLSIEAASYPRTVRGVKRATPVVADVIDAFVGAPAEHAEVARDGGQTTSPDIARRRLNLFSQNGIIRYST
jgi:hypothetical protein